MRTVHGSHGGLPCLQRKHDELVAGLELQQYEIGGNEDAWDAALATASQRTPSAISVKSDKKKEKGTASAPPKTKHTGKRAKHAM